MTAIETDVLIRQPRTGENPLKLKRIHHVEFWTGNAKQSSFFYRHAFGFSQLAYAGLETGNRDTASYVLGQGAKTYLRQGCQWGPRGIKTVIHQILEQAKADSVMERLRDDLRRKVQS